MCSYKGYISTLTYANMMYVMRKQLTPDQIEEVFRKLNLIFEFADFSPAVLERAVNMKWKDFEDAVQSATAESVHADYIITRNLKDFNQSRVMAFTPTELLAMFPSFTRRSYLQSSAGVRLEGFCTKGSEICIVYRPHKGRRVSFLSQYLR